jgi:hypothetical protein
MGELSYSAPILALIRLSPPCTLPLFDNTRF